MLRTIIGVIVGWVVFGVAALVFPLTGHDPHGPARPGFMAIAIVLGVVAAFVGGWVAALIARRRGAALGLAIVIAVIAAVSLIANRAGGSFWSPLAALLLMAPAAAFGGRARRQVAL